MVRLRGRANRRRSRDAAAAQHLADHGAEDLFLACVVGGDRGANSVLGRTQYSPVAG